MEVEELTWREQEVLALLAQRLTNREIATRLHLAESTVKEYVSRILSKLYVKNRRQAVERGKELGLLGRDKPATIEPQSNLPVATTPFIGHLETLEAIGEQLARSRLLTLTGPGGVGKTRLALKVATEVVNAFKDGCFFVSLAPIRSVEQIVQSIAEVLRIPLTTDEEPQHQLLRYLRRKQLLLVMDNYEHLLAGVSLVSQILQAAPFVTILATSRERLNLQSEMIFNVEGMALPEQETSADFLNYDAINLFVQNAGKIRQSFAPSADDLKKIAEICYMVRGMPLAIELAAAWLHILSLDEIAAELDKSLDVLASDMWDTPERHRSIRAVFEHSWFLLHSSEQQIFMRLSVFRGGFTRDAAQQVAGATLPSLRRLVNKSILSYQPGNGRFAIHELLRQYAQERLEMTPQASRLTYEAHASYYAELMASKWTDLKDKKQVQATREIEADLENIRAAWYFHVVQADVPQMGKYINSFWLLYWLRGWNQAAVDLFARGIKAIDTLPTNRESTILRAKCQAMQGFFLIWLGLADQGYLLAKESSKTLEAYHHAEGLVFAYHGLTLADYYLEYVIEEKETADKLLKIAQASNDNWTLATALALSSLATLRAKDYAEAKRLAEASLAISNKFGDLALATIATNTLGHLATAAGENDEARKCFLHCLQTANDIGFHWAKGNAIKYLGQVALLEGDLIEAEAYFRQSLKIGYDLGLDRDIVNHLYEFARLRLAQNRKTEAIILLTLLLRQPASQQTRLGSGRIKDNAKALLTKVKEDISPASFTKAQKLGETAILDEKLSELLG